MSGPHPRNLLDTVCGQEGEAGTVSDTWSSAGFEAEMSGCAMRTAAVLLTQEPRCDGEQARLWSEWQACGLHHAHAGKIVDSHVKNYVEMAVAAAAAAVTDADPTMLLEKQRALWLWLIDKTPGSM